MKSSFLTLSILGAITLSLAACEGSPQKPKASKPKTSVSTQPSTESSAPKPEKNDTADSKTTQEGSSTTTSGIPTASNPSSDTTPETTSQSASGSTATTSTGETSSTGSSSTAPEPTVPAPYAGQTNPLTQDDTATIVAGGLRYKKNCGCHVPQSKNHNPDAPDLGRPPHSELKDDWLLWKISEGVPDKMNAFKDTFSETERWEVITYLRALAVKNGNG